MLALVAGEATSKASQHFAISFPPRRASRNVSSSSWRVRTQSTAESIFRPPARRFSLSLAEFVVLVTVVSFQGHLGSAAGGVGLGLQLAGEQPFVRSEDLLLDHLPEPGEVSRGHGLSWLSAGVTSDVLERELAAHGDGGVGGISGGTSCGFGGGRGHLVSDGGGRG